MSDLINIDVWHEVNMVPRNDCCDVFIHGVDDFKPIRFRTEREAFDFIALHYGEYTITKIYKRTN